MELGASSYTIVPRTPVRRGPLESGHGPEPRADVEAPEPGPRMREVDSDSGVPGPSLLQRDVLRHGCEAPRVVAGLIRELDHGISTRNFDLTRQPNRSAVDGCRLRPRAEALAFGIADGAHRGSSRGKRRGNEALFARGVRVDVPAVADGQLDLERAPWSVA